ncbi:MAG: SHOCT domain-containing protein [Alphaproteobacteria bacterium]
MMIFWLAVFFGLIVLVVKLLVTPSRQQNSRDALKTLKQRFANGDIDIAEFQERSRQLRTAG